MSSLSDIVAELTFTLEQERDLYVAMLELAHREERAIVGGDVATLTSLTEEKEHFLEMLSALETERMTAITAMTTATGVDSESATLTALAAALPPRESVALASAGIELRQHALAFRDANDRNAVLLRSSREIVDRWLQYLRSFVSSVLYDSTGRTAEAGVQVRLDRTA